MGPARLERRPRRALDADARSARAACRLAPIDARFDPALLTLLTINGWLLTWRVFMRACFTTSAYGLAEGILSIPRLVVGNLVAILAAARALSIHFGGGATRWDKTRHIFPAELAQ